jgi:ATP-dependent DNA helicase HFM1/MER3
MLPSRNLAEQPSSPTISLLQNRRVYQGRDSQERRQQIDIQHMSQPPGPQHPPDSSQLGQLALNHAPPTIRGTRLIATSEIPDQLRTIFPYAILNVVQSKCFPTAFQSDDNLVLSAPTGSGKTLVMELAICRLLHQNRNGEFKIVYQAPTKALCAERCRDWNAKFGPFGLSCAELTGDTEYSHLRQVQEARIIITTPEKYDSVTRKWKDQIKLVQLIKLFLVDEVHILKETRGATLETVVSRMKFIGTDVRFIALSATVPNSDDIATWLGKNRSSPGQPAVREVFDESYRPVQLEKHVVGFTGASNDFGIDQTFRKQSVFPRSALTRSTEPQC